MPKHRKNKGPKRKRATASRTPCWCWCWCRCRLRLGKLRYRDQTHEVQEKLETEALVEADLLARLDEAATMRQPTRCIIQYGKMCMGSCKINTRHHSPVRVRFCLSSTKTFHHGEAAERTLRVTFASMLLNLFALTLELQNLSMGMWGHKLKHQKGLNFKFGLTSINSNLCTEVSSNRVFSACEVPRRHTGSWRLRVQKRWTIWSSTLLFQIILARIVIRWTQSWQEDWWTPWMAIARTVLHCKNKRLNRWTTDCVRDVRPLQAERRRRCSAGYRKILAAGNLKVTICAVFKLFEKRQFSIYQKNLVQHLWKVCTTHSWQSVSRWTYCFLGSRPREKKATSNKHLKTLVQQHHLQQKIRDGQYRLTRKTTVATPFTQGGTLKQEHCRNWLKKCHVPEEMLAASCTTVHGATERRQGRNQRTCTQSRTFREPRTSLSESKRYKQRQTSFRKVRSPVPFPQQERSMFVGEKSATTGTILHVSTLYFIVQGNFSTDCPQTPISRRTRKCEKRHFLVNQFFFKVLEYSHRALIRHRFSWNRVALRRTAMWHTCSGQALLCASVHTNATKKDAHFASNVRVRLFWLHRRDPNLHMLWTQSSQQWFTNMVRFSLRTHSKIHLGSHRCQTSQQHTLYLSKQVTGQSSETDRLKWPYANTLLFGAGSRAHVLLNIEVIRTNRIPPNRLRCAPGRKLKI